MLTDNLIKYVIMKHVIMIMVIVHTRIINVILVVLNRDLVMDIVIKNATTQYLLMEMVNV